ncbi:putative ribonuclease H protein [Senna tora]|uniref:Putative ribonuclease H protein n=1 Tax=Senna tora TaxID=362788 RepID=A0A834W3P5_9FABA|nr:putative ribonuclease H protein [Senna tora]
MSVKARPQHSIISKTPLPPENTQKVQDTIKIQLVPLSSVAEPKVRVYGVCILPVKIRIEDAICAPIIKPEGDALSVPNKKAITLSKGRRGFENTLPNIGVIRQNNAREHGRIAKIPILEMRDPNLVFIMHETPGKVRVSHLMRWRPLLPSLSPPNEASNMTVNGVANSLGKTHSLHAISRHRSNDRLSKSGSTYLLKQIHLLRAKASMNFLNDEIEIITLNVALQDRNTQILAQIVSEKIRPIKVPQGVSNHSSPMDCGLSKNKDIRWDKANPSFKL